MGRLPECCKLAAIGASISIYLSYGLAFAKIQPENTEPQPNYRTLQMPHHQNPRNRSATAFISYYFPPYQTSRDKPIQVQFYSPDATSLVVYLKNIATGKEYSYPMAAPPGSHFWVTQIPSSNFNRSQELELTFMPVGRSGTVLEEQVQSTRYITLNTPGYYQAPDISLPEFRIVSFQKNASSSPVFNVYWPELYYAGKPSYPLAARVMASRSPEDNIKRLDPIGDKPGWFELAVPTLWFSPGEEITVEFSSTDTQKAMEGPDYALGKSADFIPQQTLQFKTLKE